MKLFHRAINFAGLLAAVLFACSACSGGGGDKDGGPDGYDGGGDEGPIPCEDIGDCPIHHRCLDGHCVMGTICKTSDDCGAGEVCMILKEVCVPENPCTSDNDCNPPTPYCLENGGVCVECEGDEHCEEGYFCNESYACEIEGPDCTSDADCTDDAKPHCDTGQGKCYPCVEDVHCSPQFCSPSLHQCVDCYDNAHCTAGNPFCLVEAHACVECRDDDDCTGTERCSVAHQCTDLICENDADCEHLIATPQCDEASGDCVECTDHEHCPTYEWCRDMICQPGCETDAECVVKQGENYHCDTDDGSCYFAECLDDEDCTEGDLTHCKIAATPSNNACVECTADEHCDEFFYCKPGEDKCYPEPCYRYDNPDEKCKEINECYHCDWISGNCEPAKDCTYPDGDECCPGYSCESYGCELDLYCDQGDPTCATGYSCNFDYNQCEWESCCEPACGPGEFCNSDCECESGCHEAGEPCDPFSANSCCEGLTCSMFWPFCA